MNKFSALAIPVRQNIIELLAKEGELSASSIYNHFDVSPPAVSQHLKVLREANLVTIEKRAQLHIYRLNPAAISEIEVWANNLTNVWADRFRNLDKILEDEKKGVSNG